MDTLLVLRIYNGYEINKKYYKMTISKLLNDFLMTARPLLDNCLSTAFHCFTTAWQLPDNCLTTAWWGSSKFIKVYLWKCICMQIRMLHQRVSSIGVCKNAMVPIYIVHMYYILEVGYNHVAINTGHFLSNHWFFEIPIQNKTKSVISCK